MSAERFPEELLEITASYPGYKGGQQAGVPPMYITASLRGIGLSATCGEERSQLKNKQAALVGCRAMYDALYGQATCEQGPWEDVCDAFEDICPGAVESERERVEQGFPADVGYVCRIVADVVRELEQQIRELRATPVPPRAADQETE